MASARIQRWALTLSVYDYDIVFKPGNEHANADMFSHLPLADTPAEVPLPGEVILLMECLSISPVNAGHIKAWITKDPVLSRVRDAVMRGWPADLQDSEFRPYRERRNELSVQDECLLWGSGVIVPQPGRPLVIEELHASHPGMVRMKSLARSCLVARHGCQIGAESEEISHLPRKPEYACPGDIASLGMAQSPLVQTAY